MRSLFALATIFVVSASPTMAASQAQALPRIVAGSELRQLIRGAMIGDYEPQPGWMNEIFRRDGTYDQNDGAREGHAGTYYFSGNRFCVKVTNRKTVRCRSVLIDSERRTWLLEERERLFFRRVRIGRF